MCISGREGVWYIAMVVVMVVMVGYSVDQIPKIHFLMRRSIPMLIFKPIAIYVCHWSHCRILSAGDTSSQEKYRCRVLEL